MELTNLNFLVKCNSRLCRLRINPKLGKRKNIQHIAAGYWSASSGEIGESTQQITAENMNTSATATYSKTHLFA
jgi:hypothetical protein